MILTIFSCSHEAQLIADPVVPPPVAAPDSVRCWFQGHKEEWQRVPGMSLWIAQQEVQERRLREYYNISPLTLPSAKCDVPSR